MVSPAPWTMKKRPESRGSKNRKTSLRGMSQMENKIQYEIILFWSKEDRAFIAEVPELPGCAADGATYQEALANVEVVIREWIETALELGRTIPEPRCKHMYA
jgi:predicted RNase H-like HicB family nuclease